MIEEFIMYRSTTAGQAGQAEISPAYNYEQPMMANSVLNRVGDKESLVMKMIQMMKEELARNAALIIDLENRLSLVLQPLTPTDKGANNAEVSMGQGVPLLVELEGLSDRLKINNNRLEAVYDRMRL